MVQDARQRTKTYLDTYLDLGGTTWVVMYRDPSYPLVREFLEKGKDVIFAIGEPDTTPIMGHDQTPTHYDESLTIDVISMDNTTNKWTGEETLRSTLEGYPTGSQRALERRSGATLRIGSHTLYKTTFTLRYVRDLT